MCELLSRADPGPAAVFGPSGGAVIDLCATLRKIHLSIRPGRNDSLLIRLTQELRAGAARLERFTIPLDMNDPSNKIDGTVRTDPRRGSTYRELKYAFSRDRDEITGRASACGHRPRSFCSQ